MKVGDFVQLKGQPGELVGQVEELHMASIKLRRLGKVKRSYLNEMGVRTLEVEGSLEDKAEYFWVDTDELEPWKE